MGNKILQKKLNIIGGYNEYSKKRKKESLINDLVDFMIDYNFYEIQDETPNNMTMEEYCLETTKEAIEKDKGDDLVQFLSSCLRVEEYEEDKETYNKALALLERVEELYK